MLTRSKHYPITHKYRGESKVDMRHHRLLTIGAILLVAGFGSAAAQSTASISPLSAPEWSGESGASGDPTMTADAIRAAAANFQNCLASLATLAAKRHIPHATYLALTRDLTPD